MERPTDTEALEAIRRIWLAWAKQQIEADEALGGIAELLEATGRPLLHIVISPANDPA